VKPLRPMHAALSPYWVTIRTGEGRTADQRIMARNRWAAWWLGCQLFGQQNVRMVREAR
jgi:hypothetical protein